MDKDISSILANLGVSLYYCLMVIGVVIMAINDINIFAILAIVMFLPRIKTTSNINNKEDETKLD